MEMPTHEEFRRPALEVLAEAGPLKRQHLFEFVAERMALTAEQLASRLPTGESRARNRCGWALTHMHKAGLVHSVSRGLWTITDVGKSILASRAGVLDDEAIVALVPDYRERWRKARDVRNARRVDVQAGRPVGSPLLTSDSPEEVLESMSAALRERVSDEILRRLREMSWQQFERTVERVVIALGYGASGQEVREALNQGAGDQGVDGVIKEDALGLDLIYIQAKKQEAKVGRPAVQAFIGAMTGHARKGVFFTTSEFTDEAMDYAKRGLNDLRITLVDGEHLAELMIDKGLGVTETASYRTWRVDSDFFDEDL
jgi:restriction system protein